MDPKSSKRRTIHNDRRQIRNARSELAGHASCRDRKGMTATDLLPQDFLDRLRRIVPSERFDRVFDSFFYPPATTFRVNTLLTPIEPALESLRREGIEPQPIDWYVEAFRVPAVDRDRLLSSEAAARRHIYIQGASSMLPPLILAPEPGERVLDLTAAPGSKTLQLATMMGREGELAAVELARSRFFKMKALLEEYGAVTVRTYLQNGERVWRYRPDYFDRILLDAPCTTEGRFSSADPKTVAYWSTRKIKEMAGKQRRLLFSAVKSLRPGGVLVYSTCTFAPEENELMIDWVLNKFGGIIETEPIRGVMPLSAPAFDEVAVEPLQEWSGSQVHEGVSRAARILPDEQFEAFFVCRLRRI